MSNGGTWFHVCLNLQRKSPASIIPIWLLFVSNIVNLYSVGLLPDWFVKNSVKCSAIIG